MTIAEATGHAQAAIWTQPLHQVLIRAVAEHRLQACMRQPLRGDSDPRDIARESAEALLLECLEDLGLALSTLEDPATAHDWAESAQITLTRALGRLLAACGDG
jgi:hypothetical protein